MHSGGRRAVAAVTFVVLVVAPTGCSHSKHAATSTTTTLPAADRLIAAGLDAQGRGDLEGARQKYEQAVEIDPTNKLAFYDLGVVYQQLNQIDPAATAYDNALKIDATYKPALFNLAVLLTPTQPDKAIEKYRQLLALDLNDANVHFNLGLLLKQVGQADEGNAEIGTALKLDPQLAARLPVTNPQATSPSS